MLESGSHLTLVTVPKCYIWPFLAFCHTTDVKGKGKADDLYRGSMQSEDHCRTTLQYPLIYWKLCRCQQYGTFSMKALARVTQECSVDDMVHPDALTAGVLTYPDI